MASPTFHLLVVDDDQIIIDSLRLILPKNWKMTSSSSIQNFDAKMILHAAFVDMHLSGQIPGYDFKMKPAEGPGVVKQLSENNPRLEIVAMSGDNSMELMETCLKNGAHKFLAKPLISDEVLSTLEKIEALWMMRQMESKGVANERIWIGNSPQSENIRSQIASLRGESGPILIEGETGTGKEVVAFLLNQQEASRPLISVNVAAITEALFESEMFGHVRGAFTGADQQKIGLAEAANGGDLFLDEIEALPITSQVKLLRFLESGEIRKVGAKDSQHVKVRVIAATNQKLQTLVSDGTFREDLYFRLSGKKIQLPPLRERLGDIDLLAKHFFSHHRPRTNKTLSQEGLESLKLYSWPGNVRELKRICEQLALTSRLPIVRREDVDHLLASITSGGTQTNSFEFTLGLDTLLENFEVEVIQALLKIQPNIDAAADALKISRSSLYKKIRDYKIEVPS